MDFLNNTVWATIAPSPIHGVGVFAIRDIPEGTEFTDYNSLHSESSRGDRYHVRRLDMDKLLPEIRKVILDRTYYPYNTEVFVFENPNRQVCLTSFLNHSRSPNTDGRITFRPIKKGEELTENYYEIYDKGLDDMSIINSGFLV